MAGSINANGDRYRWKQAKGEKKLAPLRDRVHQVLEQSSNQLLHADAVYAKLDPPADSPAKQAAVRVALRDLCKQDLVELVSLPKAAPASRAIAAAAPSPGWACTAAPPDVFENQILKFLQDGAIAAIAANPKLRISDVWFTVADIQKGVDSTVPGNVYTVALKVNLKGCVQSRNGSFQAATV